MKSIWKIGDKSKAICESCRLLCQQRLKNEEELMKNLRCGECGIQGI